MRPSILRLALLAPLSGCAIAMGPPATKVEALPVALFGTAGERVGTAVLTADSAGMTVQLDVAGMLPGTYAAAIHDHGQCDRPEFLSSGAPIAPLGGLTVGPDGRGSARLRYAPAHGRFVPKVLFGGDGTALILGSGSSRNREACGILA